MSTIAVIDYTTIIKTIESTLIKSLNATPSTQENECEEKRIKVSDLPRDALLNSAKTLVQFLDFTFLGERNITASTALVIAMEMQACQLGLVVDFMDDDYDSATMMNELGDALRAVANDAKIPGWDSVDKHLPYHTGN